MAAIDVTEEAAARAIWRLDGRQRVLDDRFSLHFKEEDLAVDGFSFRAGFLDHYPTGRISLREDAKKLGQTFLYSPRFNETLHRG